MDTEFRWTVAIDHPAFAGHFPGRPIVPGVLLLDRALIFAAGWLGLPESGWQVANAKFLSPVGPGEELLFSLQQKANGSLTFTVDSTGRPVASGSLLPPLP